MKKNQKKVLIAFGTRPEALKFVPLIRALEQSPDFKCYVCITGQHRQMLDQVIDLFKVKVHEDLKLMKANQTLEYVSGRVIIRFGRIIKRLQPDIVFVQGDTATALMVGVASFYAQKPIAHLEAGLRTWNKFAPFPEEMNRSLLSHLADLHFTPTLIATRNLLNEGIPKDDIYQVGNTIVDTVHAAAPLVQKKYPVFSGVDTRKRLIFVTAHRRESFGEGLNQIFHGLKRIAQRFKDVEIVYPVHLNPNVSKPAHEILGNTPRIHLLRPFTYEETYWLLRQCYLILTDSGGIQEEAPSFGKPVLILRNVTERAEGIKAGVAQLVGTDAERIFKETHKLLSSRKAYKKMQARKNPYGDGRTCDRILRILRRELAGNPFRHVRTPPLNVSSRIRVKST
ncbi:MAG TPA: UDP-N-acetylglucosamine 2-epimerase (non-hydrolyzing) [Verrucomicrobiae bacterium]|nr:UDP-N-acetylglucosamine 2-epimerase (non-hydrolyzing) [Verrucomicrobiae bacterium]